MLHCRVNLSPVKLLFCLLSLTACSAPTHAQSAQDPVYVFHTNLGNISVQLFPDVAPKTVANFLTYVNSGAYTRSFIHRSVPGFIFQGGGYQVQNNTIAAIPTNPPVINEFHLSNTRGTLAMAKLGNDPNSATSEWFFNESDSNAANLDTQNGGFTVFGRVTDSASLAVMDQIAAVPVPSPPPYNSPLDQIPLINYQSGSSVQISNLVLVSAITPASGAHLLWDNSNGAASLWNYDTTSGSFTQQSYGPFPGWKARAVADGPDGLTRVLWNNSSGQTSLWSLDNSTGAYAHFEFGPYAGWTAQTLSVGPDNTTHVLWTNTNGTASLWNYSAAGGTYTQTSYGPYPGWTAKAIADGPDAPLRVLWTKADGTASLWSLNNATGAYTQHSFGPFAGYAATALSVGSDSTTHVLWNNANGAVSLWNYSLTGGTYTYHNFGPFPGYSAVGIADGADGQMRVLWTTAGGTASLWSLNSGTGSYTYHNFGPYTGWTATSISSGN